MPRTSWFKHLYNWRRKKLKKTKRMYSFKRVDKNNIIKYVDKNGNDVTKYMKYSFKENGRIYGLYVDTEKMFNIC